MLGIGAQAVVFSARFEAGHALILRGASCEVLQDLRLVFVRVEHVVCLGVVELEFLAVKGGLEFGEGGSGR